MFSHKNIHRHFKLNGNPFSKDDLCRVAYTYVKEGSPYQKHLGIFLLDWFDNNEYITLQTSGTTSKPKEITVPKIAMINSALATGDFFDLNPKDTALCCLPVNFIAGKMMVVRAFVLGLELDFIEPSANALDKVKKSYHFAALTPMQVEQSLDKLHTIDKIIIGGSKVEKSLEEKLLSIPSEIYETYASTETLTHIAARKIGEESFKLLPSISISTDDRGCLVIEAPRISDQKITTNDLVKIIADNEFLWLGRVDNIVNSGGIKINPEKIENLLSDKIPFRFFVGGVADAKLGQKLVLVIEAEEYVLPNQLFDELEKFEKPKNVFFISKFAETETGKIKRIDILNSLT